jgi:SAM-dependent methyltransferase
MQMTTESAQWSKSPKYIMRTDAIAQLTADWKPGVFAEFGVGTGTMTRDFTVRGFTGLVYDVSEDTRDWLRENVFKPGDTVTVVDDRDDVEDGSVDYLLAFEVLEHIPNDEEVLRTWASTLRSDGRVLISVPAHQRKYSATDERVGHVRRYEKAQLQSLLEACGFVDVQVINYGFPLGNISRRIMQRFESEDSGHLSPAEQVERSIRSGVEQPSIVNRLSKVANERTLKPFVLLQRRFFNRDLGDGLVATGRRP